MNPADSIWSRVANAPGLQLNDAPPATPEAVPIARRRRRAYDAAAASDTRASVSLLRDDEGLLRWVYQAPRPAHTSSRRAYRAYPLQSQNVVETFRFNDLGRNAVTAKLLDLDDWLTPGQGMKRWQAGTSGIGTWVDDAQPAVRNGRVLLLVHGTFSESKMYSTELAATAAGRQLLADWQRQYGTILAFNHPTLSVGAWSNAIDLSRALQRVAAPIDVVCHSRGGLVVSWLLRLGPVPVKRVVCVGSPLVGTSLATPDRLRAALDLLANYADVIAQVGKATSTVFPFAAGVAGLAKILGKGLRLGSGLPIIDAAVSLVPGLATQQHNQDNLDLKQLFADDWVTRPQEMSGIGVAFKPAESNEPAWKVWRRFTHLGDQAKYAGADLVFDGPNDLVVDVASMNRLGDARPNKRTSIPFTNLGESPTTHHTNYFRDERVLAELRLRLA
jgi:pimeloyl-ACP methyl ester carboxylesterase